MKTYPNKLNTFTAQLDDSDSTAKDLVKVKSVTLMKEGEIVRQLQPGTADKGWIATHSFNKEDDSGTYEVHWDFTFNGEPLDPQIDYITLQKEVKFKKDKIVEDVPSYNSDPTLPHELQFLTEYEQ
jgi:hypothetical protein